MEQTRYAFTKSLEAYQQCKLILEDMQTNIDNHSKSVL